MRFKIMMSCLLIGISAFAMADSPVQDMQLPGSVMQELKQQVDIKQGEIVYVDFWASWCAPCRKSFPWMNQMQAAYEAKGFKIIAVNVDQERALADKFLHDVPVQFDVIYDKEGRLAKSFKVKGMPSSYLIDSEGNIKVAHKGFFEKNLEQYENEIRSLLKAERAIQ